MTRHWVQRLRIRARLAVAARLTVLLGTSYFLIATSYVPPQDQSCSHASINTRFAVTGTCGQGDIVVVSPANECGISVQGATDLGLPPAGHFTPDADSDVGLLTSAWRLSGYLPEGSAVATTRPDGGFFTVVQDAGATPPPSGSVSHGSLIVRKCEASKAGLSMTLACYDGAVASCTATLTPR